MGSGAFDLNTNMMTMMLMMICVRIVMIPTIVASAMLSNGTNEMYFINRYDVDHDGDDARDGDWDDSYRRSTLCTMNKFEDHCRCSILSIAIKTVMIAIIVAPSALPLISNTTLLKCVE